MPTQKQATLIDQPEGQTSEQKAQTLATRESGLSKSLPDAGMLPMIERLAAMPDFDVAKLEKLIDMQERILNRNAKTAFDAAFAKMQPEIPEIDEHGKIPAKDGSVRSRYARLEDINRVIKPILKTFGFSIRHRTEWPPEKANIIRVVGILAHEEGHSEESVFEAEADHSDYRTDIQSQGSTVSYGRRYTTCDLLNITTRGLDNDGQRQKPEAPEGFDAFWAVLEGLAANGINDLTQAFNKGIPAFKNYAVGPHKAEWDALKAKAQKARRA